MNYEIHRALAYAMDSEKVKFESNVGNNWLSMAILVMYGVFEEM